MRRCAALVTIGAVATAAAQPVMHEPGFELTLEASGLGGLTQIIFGPDDRLYAASLGGLIVALDYDKDGVAGPPQVVANGVGTFLLGIAFDQNGTLYASSNNGGVDDTGFLARLLDNDSDGVRETHQHFVTALPNAGHHNDQLVINGQQLYVGMGSRTDDGEADAVAPVPAATMLTIDLAAVDFNSPNNIPQVYAFGLRNAFGIGLDPQGNVWVGDNGRDSPLLQDTLHRLVPGAHHGFPDELAPPQTVAPVALMGFGTSANGLAVYPDAGTWGPDYAHDIFISRFDYEFNDPQGVGKDIARVQIDNSDPNAPTGTVSVLASGFESPLDVELDPCGHLVVMDFNGSLYRIARELPDLNDDGRVDLSDLATLIADFGCSSGCAGDVDGDDDTDLSDLARVLTDFGRGCP